jgi:hypothetical protein
MLQTYKLSDTAPKSGGKAEKLYVPLAAVQPDSD